MAPMFVLEAKVCDFCFRVTSQFRFHPSDCCSSSSKLDNARYQLSTLPIIIDVIIIELATKTILNEAKITISIADA